MKSFEIKQIGRFQVEREIGRGSMGAVYLATDPVIGRRLALKIIALPEGFSDVQRAECFERFAREARAAGILSHPGIVTVYEAGRDEDKDLSYIAMEYVTGCTLQDLIRGDGRVPEAQALGIVRQIAEALSYAHGRGIVHRDLKPANVLLGDDGLMKLTDFGLARLETSELTREGQSLGSPAYMSPEQVLGRETDRRSDLFSLGVVLYEMLAGERPFRGQELSAIAYQIVHEEPLPLRCLNREASPLWEGVLSKLLAKQPDSRYVDAEALRSDLDAIADGERPAATPMADGDGERTVVDRGQEIPPSPALDDRAAARPRTFAKVVAGAARRTGVVRQMLRGALVQGSRRAWALIGGIHRSVATSLSHLAPRLVTPPRARVLSAGVLGLVPVGAIFVGHLLGAGAPVRVNMTHGLSEGRLRIQVDGREVLDQSFSGDRDPVRLFGKEVFGRNAGSFTDSFRVMPGEHEFLIQVEDGGGGEEWSRTTSRIIGEGEETVLSIRIGTGFKRGMRLHWSTADLERGT